MAHFVLIDRLLAGVGGHNFQYAVDVLQAAEAVGYEPVLAARTSFDAASDLPANWKLRTLFKYGWTRRHMAGVDGTSRRAIGTDARPIHAPSTSKSKAFWKDLLDFPKRRDREKHIEDLAGGCDVLFDELGFHAGDRIFVPTISEFDLLGLTRFLARKPESAKVAWHLQFHFDIFFGREPDYASQVKRKSLLRSQFAAALAELPDHQLHFYATTPQVAAQYNQLAIADFTPLPYPVSGALVDSPPQQEAPESEPQGPLRITLAGAMRREKGKRALAPVVDELSDLLNDGEAQIWIQSSGRKVERFLNPPWKSALEYHDEIPRNPQGPLVAVTNALDREQYLRLIKHAQIGLFLYDSQRYHSRCSGILVEMLAAGVPVIVPAGCWLSEQIQGPIYEHLQGHREQYAPSWVQLEQPTWVGGSVRSAEVTCTVAEGTRAVLCSVATPDELRQGHHMRIEAHLLDAAGDPVSEPQVTILGQAAGLTQVRALFRPVAGTHTLQLRISNAYHDAELAIQAVEMAGYCEDRRALPAGQIGLICAEANQAPRLIRELIDAYEHYRDTAATFSVNWSHQHAPLRTVEMLESRHAFANERVA